MALWNRHLGLFTCLLVLWAPKWTKTCQEEGFSEGMVQDWVKQRVLDGLGLKEPPTLSLQRPPGMRAGAASRSPSSRVAREAVVELRRYRQETSQVILFPSSDSSCALSPSQAESTSHFTYYFQPSTHSQESVVSSAHFWFYAGDQALSTNASAPLFILTAHQQLIQVAERPDKQAADGWTTYRLERHICTFMAEGPFVLQVRCPTCGCQKETDKTPFLHQHIRSRGPDRSRRSSIPWSPSSIDLLKRPSQVTPDFNDCHRLELNISFQALGWDNWIIHPKVFTFYYCHGNCSSWDRMTTVLGIQQCCAPVPGTMKSLRFRTTSDGGYSFKYETLPNLIAEDCTCI